MADFKPKWSAETRVAVINALRGGCNQSEAAYEGGITPGTLKTWLSKGRRATEGDYHDFAVAFEAAREERDADKAQLQEAEPAGTDTRPAMTEDELVQVLERSARKGSVRAAELLLRRKDKDKQPGGKDAGDADDFDALDSGDELAQRRGATE